MRNRLNRDQRGQGMTEYVIIVALVAIAAIGVVVWSSKKLNANITKIAVFRTTSAHSP